MTQKDKIYATRSTVTSTRECSWTEVYYDAALHFAWAPQLLGHRSNPGHSLKNPDGVLQRLRKIEEPLNDVLSFFFALAPSSIVRKLFIRFAGVHTDGRLDLLGRSVATKYELRNSTAPDFTLDGPSGFLTIEAKIGSLSRIDQLAKYAVVHAQAARHSPGRNQGLLFLTPSSTTRLFADCENDWGKARSLAAKHLTENAFGGLSQINSDDREVAAHLIQHLPLGRCTYSDLGDIVRANANCTTNGVEKRLYHGLLSELQSRDLVKSTLANEGKNPSSVDN